MSPCERFFDSRIVRRRSPIISIVSSPIFLNRFTHTAEPNHDTSDVGLLDITGGNARLSSDKSAKGTAARNAILSAERALRVGFRTAAVISYAVPVLHPFPDVSQMCHAIQIGSAFSHRRDASFHPNGLGTRQPHPKNHTGRNYLRRVPRIPTPPLWAGDSGTRPPYD